MIVCRHIPPAPGPQLEPVSWPRSPGNSLQYSPPSVEWNSAASSMPAYTTSAFVSDGSRCHTRLNSQGCCVPSYHWCVVSGFPVSSDASYTNLLLSPAAWPGSSLASGAEPGWCQVLPPSSEV